MRNAAANRWYRQNGMLTNENENQALILGKSEYTFSFPTKASIDILGMNIDNNLIFHNYISLLCINVNNQFNVMLRFRNLISKDTQVKLYKAYIFPHFDYCSTVWHFCSANNYILEMPKSKTTTFGVYSFTNLAIKEWNSLTNFIRLCNFTDLKQRISEANS